MEIGSATTIIVIVADEEHIAVVVVVVVNPKIDRVKIIHGLGQQSSSVTQ